MVAPVRAACQTRLNQNFIFGLRSEVDDETRAYLATAAFRISPAL